MKYNTNRTLESYQWAIDIIRNNGFKLIGVCQMLMEDTFIFETDEEAIQAHSKLENTENSEVVGFWYGKDEFEQARKKYEAQSDGFKLNVYWL